MKYLLIIVTLIFTTSCFEPSKTQETKVPNIERSTKVNPNIPSTTETLKSTYKERISPENTASVDVKEKVVIEMLTIIPEVAKYIKRVDSTSQGKNKVVFTTVDRPSADNPDYYIKIEEVAPNEKSTKFQFYVNPSNFGIKVYDPTEDIMMDLDYWQANGFGN